MKAIMKGFYERRRSSDSVGTIFTDHCSTPRPRVCLFPCWSVAINLLTNLALLLKTFERVWCARKTPGSHGSLLHTHPGPRFLPLNCYSLTPSSDRFTTPTGEIRRFLGRPRSEGLSDQPIESRVPAENHLHLILAERPSPQVMACLTSAAAARCA